ncbi:unnamed protein product [Rotaria sordida]|uniref:F-box domain-containing protein n=1 Tax=Rotaria sordida TaxID=392033 RepID=A0A819LY67_9BILA|nr:unnamed protein product [Rotaria sordida]CAF3971742.1 unnamed protein product [Rotaria sordida]
MSGDKFHSTIELLSVELWREIFEYFNANDLWYSFRDLNRKIDVIIDRTVFYLNFTKQGTYDYFMKNILSSMKAINVRSLKFTNSNEIQHFFSNFSLDSLIYLRLLSLKSMYSFNDNLFIFWSQLSSLKYLQSLEIIFCGISQVNNCVQEKKYIIHSIFNKDYCPSLKSFIISTCGTQQDTSEITSIITTTKTTNIQHVSIDLLTFNDLIKLLPALQNVKSFYTDNLLFNDGMSNEQHQSMIIIMPLLPRCIRLHVKLSDDITFEHVEYLLKQTPNLKKLFIWGWYPLLHAKKWESLLSIYCTKLINFQLICTGYIFYDNFGHAIDDFKQICQVTSFWFERNATISYDEDCLSHGYCTDINVQFNIKNKVSLIRNSHCLQYKKKRL